MLDVHLKADVFQQEKRESMGGVSGSPENISADKPGSR